MNQAGIELLKQYEGCRLQTYLDAGGIPTIGYGHTGPDVKLGQTCTQEQADQWLVEDVELAESMVKQCAVQPNDNELAAMTVFTYNVGVANFRKSSVLKLFNNGDKAGAARAFLLWDKARVHGRLMSLPGLQRRRGAEMHLFLTPCATRLVQASYEPETAVTPESPEESGVSTVEAPKIGNAGVPIATSTAIVAGGAKEALDRVGGLKDSMEWAGLDVTTMLWAFGLIAVAAMGYALYSHFTYHRSQ